jgi:hypothetical protein
LKSISARHSKWIVAILPLALVACSGDSGIGANCRAAARPGYLVGTRIVAAAECPSAACFGHEAAAQNGDDERHYCTAFCTTDDDCRGGLTTNQPGGCPASQGFVCAIATTDGGCGCHQVCICKDDLVPGANSDDSGNPVCPRACVVAGQCVFGR